MTEKSAHTATGPDQPPSNGTTEQLKLNMSEGERIRRESSARDSVQTSPVSKPENGAAAASSSPKKRRKVNHACVYCRRSHMTCDSVRPF
ncbi:Transcription factor [Aspergillus melleus]|uniref:Transcription factor n=1 Tax=Aspergillus melleus TaxID=138277 RepID=UPI001E8D6641|nr:Transcription factor [Aspergillus melleus]KAH8424731.1 Transcription factor [Aspergillus melleus]